MSAEQSDFSARRAGPYTTMWIENPTRRVRSRKKNGRPCAGYPQASSVHTLMSRSMVMESLIERIRKLLMSRAPGRKEVPHEFSKYASRVMPATCWLPSMLSRAANIYSLRYGREVYINIKTTDATSMNKTFRPISNLSASYT